MKHSSSNIKFDYSEGGICTRNLIGPLHDRVTWYKITYTGEQVAQWDFQNNAPAFVLEVPLHNLLTSICNFVPCDPVVQRAYRTLSHNAETKDFARPTSHPVRGWTGKNKAFCSPGTQKAAA